MHIDEATLKPAPKIFKEDCRIEWSWEGERIVNFVRGLSPYPAAWGAMFTDDEERGSAKIFEVTFEPKQHCCNVGTILSDGKESIDVCCANGIIHILSMQLAGKRRMSNHDLLLGFRDIESYSFR
jgi:methionyl-tRNA formyltransferase